MGHKKFDIIDSIEYYKAAYGDSTFPEDDWNINTSKRHSFRIYSDFDALDEHDEKIFVPPVEKEELLISDFSNQLATKFSNTKITTDIMGEETVVLTLGDRIVTLIFDESGSMTWNDNGKFRHLLAREIVQKIDQNYLGNVNYNILDYGADLIDLLFFGVVNDGSINTNDLTSIDKLITADPNAHYAGVRVVRHPSHFPTSVVDGEEVANGFLSKIFDTGLSSQSTMYYTVFTFDRNLKFSEGVNIKVTPRERIIPRGISTLKSWVPSSDINVGEVLKGSGVIRDQNTIGIWHFDESREDFLWDFSDSAINLKFSEDPDWLSKTFSPAGESGVRFNGISTEAKSLSGVDTSVLGMISGGQYTLMVWVYVYDLNANGNVYQTIISRKEDNDINFTDSNYAFCIGTDGSICLFLGNSTTLKFSSVCSDVGVVEENKWNHIAVTVDLSTYDPSVVDEGNVKFYVNGVSAGFGNIDAGSDTIETVPNSTSTMRFSIGLWNHFGFVALGGIFTSAFYGNITEVSFHNTIRDLDYINAQIKLLSIKNLVSKVVIGTEYTGVSGDNGDRLVVLKYEIPHDFNFKNGKVIIVKKEKEAPSWEEDGMIIHEMTIHDSGTVYVTDPGDFTHKKDYYYRIFSKNTLGNYSFLTDSPVIKFNIPGSPKTFFSILSTPIISPSSPTIGSLITKGNQKVFLRWDNNIVLDDRISRTDIYYSSNDFPVIDSEGGGSDGELIFSALLTENKFVHREIPNNQEAFYSLVNIDKYGRTSTVLIARTIPSVSADESTIPLPEVKNIHYELFDEQSINLSWDRSVTPNLGNINVYFDETVVLFAVVTDKFGIGVSEDALIDMEIDADINRVSNIDDVFDIGSGVNFQDRDAFDFVVVRDSNGIIKGLLNITSDQAIASRIDSASFTVKVRSVIPNPNNNEEDLFTYLSNPITVRFTNPWQIELINRDNLKVSERCYFVKTIFPDEGGSKLVLRASQQTFNGVHIRKSSPFIARAKLTFKGETVSSGAVNVAVWDAEEELCTCAGSEDTKCEYKGRKTKVSKTVVPPTATLPIVQGFEEIVNDEGETVQSPISFVDIPLAAPSLPQSVLLFVKGSHASFSSIKDLYIVFQNILQIDINANSPKINGQDIVEQQSTTFIINPDHPEDRSLRTVPDDLSVVQWQIIPVVSKVTRNIFSIDNVPIPNGVFSFTRNGMARNVFFGPIKGEEEAIMETHEVKATIVFNGLTSTARQFVNLEFDPKLLPEFGARFLMEMEYSYKVARRQRMWTDGADFVILYISRNPRTATTKHAETFRNCANEEDAPLLELNPSGQVVKLTAGIDEVEFLWGEDINIFIDPYTGERILEVGKKTNIAKKEAFVQLEDESLGDITTVYIRVNKFTPDAEGWKKDPECNETTEINLKCLDLDNCDLPGGDIFVRGTTSLFVNDEPFELQGGGDMSTGVPPCPITFKEPLRMDVVFTKVDGEEVDSFLDADGINSILTSSSSIDIRVEVSFVGLPVPDGTFVFLVITSNEPGQTVFIGEKNIVTTFTENGKSFADVRIIASRNPDEAITETAKIITRYNKVGSVFRERVDSFILSLDHQDLITGIEEPVDGETEPSIVPPTDDFSVFTNTAYKYDTSNNIWTQVTSMSEGKGNMFSGMVGENMYVMGGVKDNNYKISSLIEKYHISSDTWQILEKKVLTPRYGGMSITIGNDIYVIGGIRKNIDNQAIEVSNDLEVFHTDTSTWETLSSMPAVDPDTLSELSYGVAFGVAKRVNLGNKTFIYVLSGITEIDVSTGDVEIQRYNNRILRYEVGRDRWEFSRIMNSLEIQIYERISPLALLKNDLIIVFNGAFGNDQEFEYHREAYAITISEDIDNFNIVKGGSNFKIISVPKFQSCSATLNEDNPSAGSEVFVVGGANNNDGEHLDLLEKIDTISNNFSYENSLNLDNISDALLPLPTGRNGHSCEVGIINNSSFVFVVGGFSSGNDLDLVHINFDI